MSAIRDVTATFAVPETPRAPTATTSVTTTPEMTTTKTAYSPAPGVMRGASRGDVILAAQTPAAGQHLLLGARTWVRSTSRTEIQASSLPKGLQLVNGKLVGSIAGTYSIRIKVLRANGTTVMRTITVQVV